MTADKSISRNTGLDILRIISMLFVCILHYFIHGGVRDAADPESVAGITAYSIYFLAFVAVNCFVLITGYFLSRSSFKPSRFLNTAIHTLFYGVLCYFIAIKLDPSYKTEQNLFKSLTPISSGLWWYITCYVHLLVLSPMINAAFEKLSKRRLKVFLITLITLTSVVPTFLFWRRSEYFTGGYSTAWFVTLYCIAAYIGKYGIKLHPVWALLTYLATAAISVWWKIAYIGEKTEIHGYDLSELFHSYNSVITMISSVALFVFFLKLRIKGKTIPKVIGFISSLTLGVYLFHDNRFMRYIIFGELKAYESAGDVSLMLKGLALFTVTVFTVGIISDLIFKLVYRLLGFKRLGRGVDNLLEKYFNNEKDPLI